MSFNPTYPKNPVVVAQVTTVGGAASESFTYKDVKATDVVFAVLHTKGSTPVTIVRAAAAAGSVTVEFSADPSSDHVFNLLVMRDL